MIQTIGAKKAKIEKKSELHTTYAVNYERFNFASQGDSNKNGIIDNYLGTSKSHITNVQVNGLA
jgi:hypothetical protein